MERPDPTILDTQPGLLLHDRHLGCSIEALGRVDAVASRHAGARLAREGACQVGGWVVSKDCRAT